MREILLSAPRWTLAINSKCLWRHIRKISRHFKNYVAWLRKKGSDQGSPPSGSLHRWALHLTQNRKVKGVFKIKLVKNKILSIHPPLILSSILHSVLYKINYCGWRFTNPIKCSTDFYVPISHLCVNRKISKRLIILSTLTEVHFVFLHFWYNQRWQCTYTQIV